MNEYCHLKCFSLEFFKALFACLYLHKRLPTIKCNIPSLFVASQFVLIAADIPDYVQRPLHITERNMKSYTMMVYLLTLQTYSWQFGYSMRNMARGTLVS